MTGVVDQRFWEALGWIGLVLGASALAALLLLFVIAEVSMWRQRRWQARKAALINMVDALLLARRLREDREVAELDAAYELPCAPGSFFRKDTP